MVAGAAINGDECVPGEFAKWSGEVKNVFDCGWLLVDVVNGRERGETFRCEDVYVVLCCLERVWYGTVKPTKCVIRSENTSLSVVPPFL